MNSVVIHSSSIVRKGLNSVYADLKIGDLLQYSSISEFDSDTNSKIYDIIVVESGAISISNYDRLKGMCKMILGVFNNEDEMKADNVYKHKIQIWSKYPEVLNYFSDYYNCTERAIKKRKKGDNELTDRETDVLKMVALGHTNKDIADKLFISIHTVISHRKNITEKLGIKSISGLTVYAFMNNILDTSSVDVESLI